MIEACPSPQRACPYYYRRTRGPLREEQDHGCYSDTDHIIPRRLAQRFGELSVEHEIIYGPDNQQQLCRWAHDIKTDHENERQLLRELAQKVVERTSGDT